MKTKRKILPLIIVFLLSGIAKGQSSAQATMDVSVRIVSGVSTTSTTNAVSYTDGSFVGAFGSVSVAGSEKGEMLVITEKKLKLVNDSGHQISVSVEEDQFRDQAARHYDFAINKDGESPYSGVYRGTLSTTIEYM